MEDDDFNSSDLELPDAQPNPYAHLGAQSIKSMIESAFQDRRDSKLQSKTLQQSAGALGTVIAVNTWANRFDWFRTHTLNKKLETTPAAEDIERFLFSFPKSTKSKTRDSISWTYMSNGVKHIISSLKFRYRSFRLDPTDDVRLRNVLHKLREQNFITKDPTREKIWLGCMMVRRMVDAFITDAIEHGTHSWDVTCSKILSLVLQSALSARAGDISRSEGYMGLECLQWKHIWIKLITASDRSEKWVALITLAYQKGYKDDMSNSQKVQLESLPEAGKFIVCPVKWLLVLALRTGAVAQTSIEDLYQATKRTFNKSLVWQTPERPVLSAFKQQGCMLDLGRPAAPSQMLNTLKQGGELIGMLLSPVTHDLRCGAAAETAHLPKSLRGASDVDAARVLGHQPGVRDRGITAAYIGHLREDTWNRRLENPLEDSSGPHLVSQPFKRSRQSTETVLAICNELGLDPNNRKDRIRAQDIGKRRLKDDWKTHGQSSQVDKEVDHTPKGYIDETNHYGTRDNELLDNIDPQPQKVSQLMLHEISPCDLAAASDSLDMLPDLSLTTTATFVSSDPIAFIDKFSKRNDIRNEVAGDAIPISAVSGGSRDAPSRWMYRCVNAPACTREFKTRRLRDSHTNNCDPSSEIAHPFVCTHEDCESTFPTQNGLSIHLKHVHGSWVPVGYDEEDCGSMEIFQNFHSAWHPRKCYVPECPERKTFEKRNAFVKHLASEHPQQKEQYMPPKTNKRKRQPNPETINWTTSRCLYPGCESKHDYTRRDTYVQHLRVQHGVYSKDARPYMPTTESNE